MWDTLHARGVAAASGCTGGYGIRPYGSPCGEFVGADARIGPRASTARPYSCTYFYCALLPSVTFSVRTLPSRSTCRLTVSPTSLSAR